MRPAGSRPGLRFATDRGDCDRRVASAHPGVHRALARRLAGGGRGVLRRGPARGANLRPPSRPFQVRRRPGGGGAGPRRRRARRGDRRLARGGWRIAPTPWVLAIGARSAGLLAAAVATSIRCATFVLDLLEHERRADALRARPSAAGAPARSIAARRRSASPTRHCGERSPSSRAAVRRSGPRARGRARSGSGSGLRDARPDDTERGAAEPAAPGREAARSRSGLPRPETVGNVLVGSTRSSGSTPAPSSAPVMTAGGAAAAATTADREGEAPTRGE